MSDRLSRVAGNHVSCTALLGSNVRPRNRPKDGTCDRGDDAVARGPPGPGARAGCCTRCALGSSRGMHFRGSVRGGLDRHELRARAAGGPCRCDTQALRGLLGLPGRTQYGTCSRRAPRASRRPAHPVRDGRPGRGRGVSAALVCRGRRDARRGGSLTPDRPAAGSMGVRRHGRRGLLRRGLPRLPAPCRGGPDRRCRAGARGWRRRGAPNWQCLSRAARGRRAVRDSVRGAG